MTILFYLINTVNTTILYMFYKKLTRKKAMKFPYGIADFKKMIDRNFNYL